MRRQVRYLAQQGLQALFAELLVAGILRFGDAVRERDEHVTRSQIDRALLVAHIGKETDDRSSGCELLDLAGRSVV